MAKQTKKQDENIEIVQIKQGRVEFYIVGESPLVLNRMSQKAKGEIFLPGGRKSAAAKAASLKHDPFKEFADSADKIDDPKASTLLAVKSTAFKGAIASAAIDIPGAAKAQIGRLTYVESEYVPIWGVPQIYSAVVRCKDMNRTPDIRTRMIVPRWATRIAVRFVSPILNITTVANLLGASGTFVGVGDGRPEKGKLSFGRFRVVEQDDADFKAIIAEGGRRSQIEAIKNPTSYDSDTEDLLAMFQIEIKRRGRSSELSNAFAEEVAA